MLPSSLQNPTGEDSMATRKATAQWSGDLQDGGGTMALGSGAFEGQYSYKSRFEEGAGTNPEELIAAAHAGCFTMALSLGLSQAGHAPEALHTDANVHLRQVEGVPTITRIDLSTRGRVPGIDEAAFAQAAEAAKKGCPVSRALAGVDEVTLEATLES
jgi:lipoyl-dependent peroxiredoxin